LAVILEIGSNIINTTIRKITNWVHLATITMVHYDLIIITTIRKIIDHYFGHTRINNLMMSILISALIIFLTGINAYILQYVYKTLLIHQNYKVLLINNIITYILLQLVS